MAIEQLSNGISLVCGVGQTIEDYIIESIEVGGADIDSVDVKDEDGKLVWRGIKDKHPKTTLTMTMKDGATPETDWPEGAFSVVTGFTDYYVDSCTVSRTEDPAKVTVQLTRLANLAASGT